MLIELQDFWQTQTLLTEFLVDIGMQTSPKTILPRPWIIKYLLDMVKIFMVGLGWVLEFNHISFLQHSNPSTFYLLTAETHSLGRLIEMPPLGEERKFSEEHVEQNKKKSVWLYYC